MAVGNISDDVWHTVEYVDFGIYMERFKIIDFLPRLHHVYEIHSLPSNWPSATSSVMGLRNLRKTAIRCDPIHLWKLQCPSLQSLTVSDIDKTPQSQRDVPQPAEFPSLISLTVITRRPHTWINNMSSPRLASLSVTLSSSFNDNYLLKSTDLSKFSLLRQFVLETACDDETMIAFLEALPQVTSVTMIYRMFPCNFGYKMIIRLAEMNTGSICCPDLQVLTVGAQRRFLDKEGAERLGPAIGDMLRTRKEYGSPIQRLQIFCKEGSSINPDLMDEECVRISYCS